MYGKTNEHLLAREVTPHHVLFSKFSIGRGAASFIDDISSGLGAASALDNMSNLLEVAEIQRERLMSKALKYMEMERLQRERLMSKALKYMEERILHPLPSIGFPNIIRGRLSTDSFPPLVPGRPYTPSPVPPTAVTEEVYEEISPEIIPAPSRELVPITDHKPVFIVHGHDHETRDDVSKFVSNWGLTATILDEQPNKGRTIIEKFEDLANDAGFAIVLLTPDDVGSSVKDTANLKPRARQNVILELGYFLKAVGRPKVCILYKEGVELPSDIHGILYVHMDDAGEWRQKVSKEMKSVGLLIDRNKI